MPSSYFFLNGLFPMENEIKDNDDDDSAHNRLYDASYRAR